MPLNHDEAVLSLLDGPPLSSFSAGELQSEVADLLGDDDPLAVALVIEEAVSRADEQERAAAVAEIGLETCRLEQPCAGQYAVSGTGRCMECGAQRRKPDVVLESNPGGDEQVEARYQSDTEAAPQPVSPLPTAPATVIPPASGEPLTGRVKAALGLPDKDMAQLLGVARPTAQAYATGRIPEIIDGVRAEYLLRAVKKRLVELETLRTELQTLVAVSD